MVWITLAAFFLLVHLVYKAERARNLFAADLEAAKKEYQRLLEEYMAALGELSAAKAELTNARVEFAELSRKYGDLVLKHKEAEERLLSGGLLQ